MIRELSAEESRQVLQGKVELNWTIATLRIMYADNRLPEYNWEIDFLLRFYLGPKDIRDIAEKTFGSMQERLEKEYFAQ